MTQNPHPATITQVFSFTDQKDVFPNQRHQDWASGHAAAMQEAVEELELYCHHRTPRIQKRECLTCWFEFRKGVKP